MKSLPARVALPERRACGEERRGYDVLKVMVGRLARWQHTQATFKTSRCRHARDLGVGAEAGGGDPSDLAGAIRRSPMRPLADDVLNRRRRGDWGRPGGRAFRLLVELASCPRGAAGWSAICRSWRASADSPRLAGRHAGPPGAGF